MIHNSGTGQPDCGVTTTMKNDFTNMEEECKTYTSRMVDNPYRGISTFFGIPNCEDP